MKPPVIIVHERLAEWSRQLKPRFRGTPIRWSETRSRSDLIQACAGSTCPILLIDLSRSAIQGLEDLDAGLRVAPDALSVALDPGSRPGVASLARELGATIVLSGVVVPPELVKLLRRWIPIAQVRAVSSGWSVSTQPEPEIWEHPDPLAAVGLLSST